MIRSVIGIGAKVGGTIIASMATERMLIWALRLLAKRSDTMIDDHAVNVIDAALQNDADGVREAGQALATSAVEQWDHR